MFKLNLKKAECVMQAIFFKCLYYHCMIISDLNLQKLEDYQRTMDDQNIQSCVNALIYIYRFV